LQLRLYLYPVTMSTDKNEYQWASTENALAFINLHVVKNKMKQDPEKIFLETPCFVTEKYDGTNLAKDDAGIIYSRRFALGDDEQEFIKTSLKNVRDADIKKFKTLLVESAGLDPENIEKMIVYGEFLCNHLYDYEQRGIIGNWKVFGVKMEVKEDGPEILRKLRGLGYAVPNRSHGGPNQVKIYANPKLFEVAKQAGLDVPDVMGVDVSFVKMVEMNKEKMKTGALEGLVITLDTDDNGYKFIKWKGSQEFQPHAHKNFEKANERIQNSGTHEDIKKAFDMILDINTDLSQNKIAQENMKKTKPGQQKPSNKKSKEKKEGTTLTEVDKDIIILGIAHCQKKFDSIEEFHKRGESALNEYIETLTKEVQDHLAKEKETNVDDDGEAMVFIRKNVRATIDKQLADKV